MLTFEMTNKCFIGTVHITWVISACLAWMLGLKADDYKGHQGYQVHHVHQGYHS